MAVRLVIGMFGSRGGRFMTSGSPGSTVMMTTPGTVAKKSRYSTIVGVSATPWLMLNTLAATNSITSLDLSRVWQGWPPVDGGQDFDHGFCSVSRGGDRLSRRWRRVPRTGYFTPGRRGCRDRVRAGSAGAWWSASLR